MFKRKSKSDKAEKKAKPKKAKKEKKPKTPRAKAPAVPVNKAPTDIYTVMIVISTLAVAVGCILLLMELNRYGSYPWWKA